MAQKFVCLVLIFVLCVDHSHGNTTDDKSHDTSEFNSEQRTLLANFTGESRSFFKKDLWKWNEQVEIKRLKLYGDLFMNWFRCAIGTAKYTLDRAFLIPRSLFNKNELEDAALPKDFTDLNATHDRWIDDFFEEKVKKRKNPSTYPQLPPTRRIKESYLYWYNLITLKKEVRLYQDVNIVNAILDDLKIIQSSNPAKYPDDETIRSRFAASLARTYRIVDCVHYDLDSKLFESARKSPYKKFSRVLLDMLPTWYMSHEDIVFLNVIVKAYTRKAHDRIKCIGVQNEKLEWVAVPYEISDLCGRDNIDVTFAAGFSTILAK